MAELPLLVDELRRWMRGERRSKSTTPSTGKVHFGDLRRVTPISRAFGFERGRPVDRYYIERFLASHAGSVRGTVLEIGDDAYTRRYGGARVGRSDILSLTPDNPKATIIADLSRAEHVASNSFDCIIFTQTLQFIYDLVAAVETLHRSLKPDGVLLATFPAFSQICRYDMDRWGDYWRFTDASIRRLLSDVFSPERVTVETHGNVLTAISFLHGLAAEELTTRELDHYDRDYPLLITAVAIKGRSRNGRGAPRMCNRVE